jgi:hypothetical protein
MGIDMKTNEEELAELDEQKALAEAELDAMAEEAGSGVPLLPARARFFGLRRRHLEKGIEKLIARRTAKVAYVDWDRRTKP